MEYQTHAPPQGQAISGAGSGQPNSYNTYNGMPRSRQQQHLEDMLLSPGNERPEEIQRPISRANQPPPRSGSAMSFNRRISNSSINSRSGNTPSNGFFGWGKKKSFNNDADDFDDEDNHGLNGRAEDVPDISMNELTILRDRDRYPTVQQTSGQSNNGRTMSISSTMSTGGFDTTPVIPTIRTSASFGGQQNGQYRKNLTNSLKHSIRSEGRVPPGPASPAPPPGNQHYNGYPMQQQRSFPPPHHPQQYQRRSGPGPIPPNDPRLRSMTGGPPPEFSPSQRSMSMNGFYGPPPPQNGYTSPIPGSQSGFGPGPTPNFGPISNAQPPQGPPRQRISRPPSRLSQQQSPMVTTSTMTDPIDISNLPSTENNSSNASTNSTDSIGDGTATSATTASSVSATPVKTIVTNSGDVEELRNINKSLLDEIRLVTSELADSIRRELGITDSDDELQMDSVSNTTTEFLEPRQRAQKLMILERELDLERRKRMISQQKHEGDDLHDLLTKTQYKYTELERDLAEKDRLYTSEKRETEILKETVSKLTGEYEELQLETNQLKNGILPELKSHVADLEVLTAAGNPIELLKQIEELKVENKKLQNLVEENSMRGPLGEKIKAVESQRDALREALRSLKERNDHEIRESGERVRQLEAKLEKEKVISNQMQRKLVQTRSPSSYVLSSLNGNESNISPSTKHHTLSSSSSSGSLNSGFNGSNNLNQDNTTSSLNINNASTNTLSIPKRRGIGQLPGIIPPSVTFSNDSRPTSPSPVNFEISQEPAWIDYVNPSKLPVSKAHARQFSSGSYTSQLSQSPTISPSESTLFKPNRRTEQIPLSLSPVTATTTS